MIRIRKNSIEKILPPPSELTPRPFVVSTTPDELFEHSVRDAEHPAVNNEMDSKKEW